MKPIKNPPPSYARGMRWRVRQRRLGRETRWLLRCERRRNDSHTQWTILGRYALAAGKRWPEYPIWELYTMRWRNGALEVVPIPMRQIELCRWELENWYTEGGGT